MSSVESRGSAHSNPSLTSRSSTPPSPIAAPTRSSSSSSYLPSSFSSAVSNFLRRLSTEPAIPAAHSMPTLDDEAEQSHHRLAGHHAATMPSFHKLSDDGISGVYTPPRRHASPFQPPPLSSLVLKGYKSDTPASAQLLSRALAEEIRLLIPARLQLVEDWDLAYSLEQDGISLATLYKKCEHLSGGKEGFVLVVRDGSGGVFGAFLTNPPSPGPHYYGTGECFLWKASFVSPLSSLPLPPSADTADMTRSTTISNGNGALPLPSFSNGISPSGQTTPGHLRFKAFPYSGMNDYMILCDQSFLSVGGGDGHYGLWLDDIFEKGISSRCLTFGNEPLSDVGEKFDILGVELWHIG
ncbi:hypothetical protein FGG08_003476 [Glutinoglossum americanum]|uniref:Oxidation resistance protein 1 n=1 Tax=Glutinoglossum americanum TaxID=1670608 RepID=A0A9P8L3H1_9PEZI|nr:hypothetical protein FGG08_003476 [Glutinoglossum americanum]